MFGRKARGSTRSTALGGHPALIGHITVARFLVPLQFYGLYFTKALVLASLPGIVEDMDGDLVLCNDPDVLDEKLLRAAVAQGD